MKMKQFVVVCLFVILSVTVAVPIDDSKNAQILRYDSDNIGTDGYSFAFETSDGTSRQEQAQLKNVGGENPALAVRGTVSWVGADGQQYTLNYVADENGFQPEGAHLPRA